MSFIQNNKIFFEQLLTLLEHQFGIDTEIVLHDHMKPYDHSIVDIRNGHITNRKIGDCGSNLGLEVLKGTVKDGDRYNYITFLNSSKILRSSSMYIKDNDGNVVGALCINTDITESIQLENFLKRYNNYDLNEEQNQKEVFVNNVHDLLDHLLLEAQTMIDKSKDSMNKQDRINFLQYLDNKGAFLITKSGEKVCDYLGISKFTLYKYLDTIRTGGDNFEDEELGISKL